ncbi:MAG: hypothetical protein EBR09_11260 [Proteobacteria bacterium]|nr:hypothetical protein [Pseudomonadota bacterium]
MLKIYSLLANESPEIKEKDDRMKSFGRSLQVNKVLVLVFSVFAGCGKKPAQRGSVGSIDSAVRVVNLQMPSAEREVHSSYQTGFGPTLILYRFTAQSAILKLWIHNKDNAFQRNAELYMFKTTESDSALKGWMNNQWSDGNALDAALPSNVYPFPVDCCTVVNLREIEKVQNLQKDYVRYEVEFEFRHQQMKDKFTLDSFRDKVDVYVPVSSADPK